MQTSTKIKLQRLIKIPKPLHFDFEIASVTWSHEIVCSAPDNIHVQLYVSSVATSRIRKQLQQQIQAQ